MLSPESYRLGLRPRENALGARSLLQNPFERFNVFLFNKPKRFFFFFFLITENSVADSHCVAQHRSTIDPRSPLSQQNPRALLSLTGQPTAIIARVKARAIYPVAVNTDRMSRLRVRRVVSPREPTQRSLGGTVELFPPTRVLFLRGLPDDIV